MDIAKEPSNHERSIEDYLFSGYQPSLNEVAFDNDQQFAKPIEDEDMFGTLELEKSSGKETQTSCPSWKDRYKELAKGIVPQKLAADQDENGMIDINIDIDIGSDNASNAKAIFEKAKLRRVKDKYGLYKGQKLYWDRYHDYLLEKMSSVKRERWESFQHPPDRYNDEEELIDEEENDGEEVENDEGRSGNDNDDAGDGMEDVNEAELDDNEQGDGDRRDIDLFGEVSDGDESRGHEVMEDDEELVDEEESDIEDSSNNEEFEDSEDDKCEEEEQVDDEPDDPRRPAPRILIHESSEESD